MLVLPPQRRTGAPDRGGYFWPGSERPVEALGAIQRYRELAPHAQDGEEIDAIVVNLRVQIGFSN